MFAGAGLIFFLHVMTMPACAYVIEKITATNVKPLTLVLLAGFSLLFFILPRRSLALVYILLTILIPIEQRFIIGGVDLTVARIFILIGIFRTGGMKFKWNKMDTAVFTLAAVTFMISVLLHQTLAAVVHRSGLFLDTIGLYWIFRQTIHGWKDIKFLIKIFGIGLLLLTPLIFMEWKTGENPFNMLYSFPRDIMRAGAHRSHGAFVHPIVMGTFWALLFPLFFGMLWLSRNKGFLIAVLLSVLFVIFASRSSTPIGVLIIIGPLLFLFSKRYYTKNILQWVFVAFVSFHFLFLIIRGKPIWWLLTKGNTVSSSTGWYRYYLFDLFIKHFKEWWLVGTADTASWDPYLKTWDWTNQYVVEGVTGGVWGLCLFVGILVLVFKTLIAHYQWASVFEERLLTWCLAISFVGFIFAFFGIQLYGQMNVLWYFFLSIVAFIYGQQRSSKEKISGMDLK